MLFTKTKPCNQCPFRKVSAAGWLGDATAEDFIQSALNDELMPCHSTVDYTKKDWKTKMMTAKSQVQHCAGARIMYRNQCKRSKDATFMAAERDGKVANVEPSEAVFTWRNEFLEHHHGRVVVRKDDDEEMREVVVGKRKHGRAAPSPLYFWPGV